MTTQSIEGAMPPLPEPVARQFESKGGWFGFMNDDHYRNTVEAGYKVRDLFAADQLQAYAAPLLARVAELEKDAARYRAFFDSGLPVCFLGEEYASKSECDTAIDAALAAHKEQP